MKLQVPINVADLAGRLEAKLIGKDDNLVLGINEIHKVRQGDLTFVDIEKYYKASLASEATVILINKEVPCPSGKTLLVVEDPFEAYNSLVKKYCPTRVLTQPIASSAEIHDTAILEPFVVVGEGVTIGAGTYIQSHCYIGNDTEIGERVIIQAGTQIGTDAFYFKEGPEGFEKWQSGGKVRIEDDVFIGASCTINRGVSGTTIIGRGTKIDSQVHVGHGAEIGSSCLLAGQVGVGGKAIIGNRVKIYGQAGIANNIRVGNDSIILAKAGVLNDIDGGTSYFGLPAIESRKKFAELVVLRQLAAKGRRKK